MKARLLRIWNSPRVPLALSLTVAGLWGYCASRLFPAPAGVLVGLLGGMLCGFLGARWANRRSDAAFNAYLDTLRADFERQRAAFIARARARAAGEN